MNTYEVRILVAGNIMIESVDAKRYEWNETDVSFFGSGGSPWVSYSAPMVVSVTVKWQTE